ncbi:MAG: hypothetical protein ACPLPX_03540 [Candidatus Kapaibacteriota bacterium]
MKFCFGIVASIILLFYGSFSQNSGIRPTVLLKGRVLNHKTLAPIETKFYLVGEDGKKIQVNSSNDGSFNIPLSVSGNYLIQADNWICVDPSSINIKVASSYSEQDVTLFFLPFESGLVLKKVQGFSEPFAHLTKEGQDALSLACNLNKSNPKLFFQIVIRVEEGQFKEQTKLISEGKKKKKIKITQRQQAEEFAQALISEIKSFLATNKLPERKYSINVEYISGAKGRKISTQKGKEKKQPTSSFGKENLEIKIETVLRTDLPNSK